MGDRSNAAADRPTGHVDVTTVPVYPVVRLSVSPLESVREASGLRDVARWVGAVDGVELVCGDQQLVHDLLVEAASTRAARRPQGAIRALFAGDDLADGEAAVVTADREVLTEGGAGSKRAGRRFSGRLALVAGAVCVGAVGITAVGVSVAAGWGRDVPRPAATATATPTPTQLPVLAPAGWASVASWSAPVGTVSGATVNAVAVGRLVIVPAPTAGSIRALDEVSGAQVWSASVPGGMTGSSLAGGPVLVRMGARQVVVAWSASMVAAWDPSTGTEVGSWSVPSDAGQVTVVGDRVLVAGQSRHVGVLGRDGLVWRVLPAGAKPVGATAKDELLATAVNRLWRISSNTVAGPGVVLAAPTGASWAGQAMVAGGRLVVPYSPKNATNGVVLRSFDVATGKAQWTSKPVRSAATGLSSTALWVAPAGSWGVYGSTWLNLARGMTKALPEDWSTTAIGKGVALGTSASRPGSVSSTGAAVVQQVAQDGSDAGLATAPVGVTDHGDALVVAADGQASRVYFVPQVATTSPSATARSSSAPRPSTRSRVSASGGAR